MRTFSIRTFIVLYFVLASLVPVSQASDQYQYEDNFGNLAKDPPALRNRQILDGLCLENTDFKDSLKKELKDVKNPGPYLKVSLKMFLVSCNHLATFVNQNSPAIPAKYKPIVEEAIFWNDFSKMEYFSDKAKFTKEVNQYVTANADVFLKIFIARAAENQTGGSVH